MENKKDVNFDNFNWLFVKEIQQFTKKECCQVVLSKMCNYFSPSTDDKSMRRRKWIIFCVRKNVLRKVARNNLSNSRVPLEGVDGGGGLVGVDGGGLGGGGNVVFLDDGGGAGGGRGGGGQQQQPQHHFLAAICFVLSLDEQQNERVRERERKRECRSRAANGRASASGPICTLL